jgi:hypothetical protein
MFVFAFLVIYLLCSILSGPISSTTGPCATPARCHSYGFVPDTSHTQGLLSCLISQWFSYSSQVLEHHIALYDFFGEGAEMDKDYVLPFSTGDLITVRCSLSWFLTIVATMAECAAAVY